MPTKRKKTSAKTASKQTKKPVKKTTGKASVARTKKKKSTRPSHSKKTAKKTIVTKKRAASKTKAKRKKLVKTSTKKSVQPTLTAFQSGLSFFSKRNKSWFLSIQNIFTGWKLFGFVIVLLNVVILSGLYLQHQRYSLSFSVTPVVTHQPQVPTTSPATVSIPAAEISLSVTPAHIINGIWETSETTATYLSTSAHPGEGSNVVIYGHNRPSLFRNLHQVSIGDTIVVVDQRHTTFEYVVESIQVVTPDQIEVVLPTDHEQLTLYTCTRFLDTHRLVVTARPTKVTASL